MAQISAWHLMVTPTGVSWSMSEATSSTLDADSANRFPSSWRRLGSARYPNLITSRAVPEVIAENGGQRYARA